MTEHPVERELHREVKRLVRAAEVIALVMVVTSVVIFLTDQDANMRLLGSIILFGAAVLMTFASPVSRSRKRASETATH